MKNLFSSKINNNVNGPSYIPVCSGCTTNCEYGCGASCTEYCDGVCRDSCERSCHDSCGMLVFF